MPMLPISAAELASIQADAAAAACDQPCTINRATLGSLPSGGQSQTWNPISPAGLLAGMAEPTSSMLENYGYLVGALAAWMIKLPVGTNVQENDQLAISGQKLNVAKLLTPRSYPSLITLLAVEVK